MDFDPADPPPALVTFLTERHIASLAVTRPDGSPQVTPIGVTYDPGTRLARIITWADAYKARVLLGDPGQSVAINQVDGGRWVTMYGTATVTTDPDRVGEALRRYSERYRPPKQRDDRVAIEVAVKRMVGRVPGP